MLLTIDVNGHVSNSCAITNETPRKKRLQDTEPQQIIYQLKARDECKKKKQKRTHLHDEKRR